MKRLQTKTARLITEIFGRLDYERLSPIYCDEGGDAFWNDRRGPCQILGIALAEVLLNRLPAAGRSLYVGAGVAELPVLLMEVLDLGRSFDAFNLRAGEVGVLNQACKGLPFRISGHDARSARGTFDHLWIVSVLNDPEQYPEVSALSYGRANPVTFDSTAFADQRTNVLTLADACLRKLVLPALVSTSVEEIPWITEWCERNKIEYVVEEEDYPTAIVEDPVCFITLGLGSASKKRL
ncbi:MAG: hypothetical protein ABI945_05225 [Nitrospirales bacterium]